MTADREKEKLLLVKMIHRFQQLANATELQLNQTKADADRERLREIISFADGQLESHKNEPPDEYILDIAAIQIEAMNLLADYDKLGGSPNGDLSVFSERWSDLNGLIECITLIVAPGMIQEVDAILI